MTEFKAVIELLLSLYVVELEAGMHNHECRRRTGLGSVVMS